MTALYILCGIALAVGLILLINVGIEMKYDGEITLCLRLACFRFRLIPKRQKKVRLRRFSKKRYEKLIAEERRKAGGEKADKKRTAGKHDKVQETPAKRREKRLERKQLVSDLWEMRSVIAGILGDLLCSIRTRSVKVRVVLGAEDAASCALLYGAVSQFAAYALGLIRSRTHMRCREEVSICADFTSEQTVADIGFCFCIRVGSILAAVFRLGAAYFKKLIREK